VTGAVLFLTTANAFADKRVALVMGNSAYKNVVRLPNPAEDASAIASMLKSIGFDTVLERNDLSGTAMRRAVREFTEAAEDADIAVVFYAGHGMEIDGNNYLIPIDAMLDSDLDVDDEAVSLDRFMRSLESVRRLRLIILDACRDNPFTKRIKRTAASRSIGRGLARIDPAISDTLVAFAAKAGSTASDGNGKHSPFTSALLETIPVPGLDIRLALGRVRDEVWEKTGHKQEPFVYGSLGGSTVALVPPAEVKHIEPPPQPVAPNVNISRDYEFAERIGTKEAWDSFLATYSTGFYSDLAKAARAKLSGTEQQRAQSAEELRQKAAEDTRLKAEAEAKREADARLKAAAEAKRAAEIEAKLKAEAEAKRKADEEARLKAEAESKREADARLKAAAEAKRAAEMEAKLKAEAEAKRKADEDVRLKAEADAKVKAVDSNKSSTSIVVAMAPTQPIIEPQTKSVGPSIDSADLARLLQFHLKRVGCDPGSSEGIWNDGSRRALEQFNERVGTKFDAKVASIDALDTVRAQKVRVCPLVCGKGHRIEGDHCAPEPRQTARPKQAPDAKRSADESGVDAKGGSGQVYCSEKGGCNSVPKNCRITNINSGTAGHGGVAGQALVCN
jgi:hypothetical protein